MKLKLKIYAGKQLKRALAYPDFQLSSDFQVASKHNTFCLKEVRLV